MILVRRLSWLALWMMAGSLEAAPNDVVALLVVLGDQHSAYERTAQIVALVDQLKMDNPGLPLAILLNGDTLEHGNPVARRSRGEVDFAMFAALARRAPTILNLGNHEPEFYDMAESVKRIEATGVKVVSNIRDQATHELFAPASMTLQLGETKAVIVGVSTDRLATYRVAVQPSLDLSNPVIWATENLPSLLAAAPLKIVLSHAGIAADREMFDWVPDGTLFAGAHNHLRFVHPINRTVYFHSGFWNEYATLIWLAENPSGSLSAKRIEQRRVTADSRADPELAALIQKTEETFLTAEDRAVVGKIPRALLPEEAARFSVAAIRKAARVDAAFIGNTTFGAGLPAGEIKRVQFDACVRFDGVLYTAEVDGARLQALLANSNQNEGTLFTQRTGEYLIADGPAEIDPSRRYQIATTDWGARNTQRYFGPPEITWKELPGSRLKEWVLRMWPDTPLDAITR